MLAVPEPYYPVKEEPDDLDNTSLENSSVSIQPSTANTAPQEPVSTQPSTANTAPQEPVSTQPPRVNTAPQEPATSTASIAIPILHPGQIVTRSGRISKPNRRYQDYVV